VKPGPIVAGPAVNAVAPNAGSIAGGTVVTLTGTNFQVGATVSFGGSMCSNVTVLRTTSITCTTPAHAAAVVSVTVANLDGGVATLASAFTYTSSPPATFLVVSPSTVTFPDTIVGTPSLPSQIITLTNNGNDAVQLESFSGTLDFPTQTAFNGLTCQRGGSVGPHASCTFSVNFNPQTVGPLSFTVVVTTNVGTLSVPLFGTAVTPILSFSPRPLFMETPLGTISPPALITLTNTSTATVQITSIVSDASRNFTMIGLPSCYNAGQYLPVSPGGTCTFSVTFTPSFVGTGSANAIVRTDRGGEFHLLMIGTGR
jgi:IPT/TIG domain